MRAEEAIITHKRKIKEILCLMIALISDIDKANLYSQFLRPLAQCAVSLVRVLIHMNNSKSGR